MEYLKVAIFTKMIPNQEKVKAHGRIMFRCVGGPSSVIRVWNTVGKKLGGKRDGKKWPASQGY